VAQLAADHPAWGPYAALWQEQLARGLGLVSELQAQVSAEG